MENINQASHDNTAPASGPGKLLYQARKDLRLAPEDVAQILHLSSKQIIALEQDDYKHLPGPTYVRGYLRSYAQLLGLSPEKVLDSYNGLTLPSKPIAPPPSAPPQITSNHRLVKAATIGVAAMVLGLVYLWWRSQEEAPPPSSPPAVASQAPAPFTSPVAPENTPAPPSAGMPVTLNSAHAPVVTEPALESVAGNISRAPNGATPASAAKTAAPTGQLTASGTILNASPAEPSKPEATTTRTDRAMRVRRAADVPPGVTRSRLVLRATQESWADIRDARDNKLLYENVPAGRSIAIEGVAPFSVFLGNADGVRVEFNGQDFDISRYKRGQVARFMLGEEKAENN